MDVRSPGFPATADPLSRLRGDEAALEGAVTQARAAAAAELELARREAERIVAEARRGAEAEREALRAATDEALRREAEEARADDLAAVERLRARAEALRAEAVARVLGVVTGEAP